VLRGPGRADDRRDRPPPGGVRAIRPPPPARGEGLGSRLAPQRARLQGARRRL